VNRSRIVLLAQFRGRMDILALCLALLLLVFIVEIFLIYIYDMVPPTVVLLSIDFF